MLSAGRVTESLVVRGWEDRVNAVTVCVSCTNRREQVSSRPLLMLGLLDKWNGGPAERSAIGHTCNTQSSMMWMTTETNSPSALIIIALNSASKLSQSVRKTHLEVATAPLLHSRTFPSPESCTRTMGHR